MQGGTPTRLTTQWQTEAKAFNERSLADSDYVYVWADGIHLKVRLTQDKVCLLVMIGVRPDGKKELIALADGHRESTESWADLLRSCKRRGMVAPVLAAGDGALGFWAGLRDVFPETKEQRCWFHKSANVLNCLPKSAHTGREGRPLCQVEVRRPDRCGVTRRASINSTLSGTRSRAAYAVTGSLGHTSHVRVIRILQTLPGVFVNNWASSD